MFARGAAPAARSGWLPAVLGLVALGALLTRVGVSRHDVVVFAAYVALGLVLPGTLLWRLVARDEPRPFVTDLALGTSLAYAVELLVYLPSRAVGLPRLVLVWPLMVVIGSLLPRWRSRLWRPAAIQRVSTGWSWALAGLLGVAFAFVDRVSWQTAPISATALRFPYPDQPYHLSLIAELRHHVPPSSPTVSGQPLAYHWFVHAEMAATSWATGIEPEVLLDRLSLIPVIVVVLIGSAAVAGRLTRSPYAGLLAPLFLVTGGVTLSTLDGASFLSPVLYLSPTNTFAQALLVPTLALVLPMVTVRRAPRRREWATLALLLASLSGAKVTILPILLAGLLGTALLAGALRSRRATRTLVMGALSALMMVAAALTVYAGGARGLTVDTLVLARYQAVTQGLAGGSREVSTATALAVALVFVASQFTYAAGLVGLARRRLWMTPAAQVLVVTGVAGCVATYTFSSLSLSQEYFLRMTPVPFAVAAAYGTAQLLTRRPSRRLSIALTACVAVGVLVAECVRRGVGGFVTPYVVVVAAVATATAVSAAAARRWPSWRGRTAGLAVCLVIGLGVPTSVDAIAHHPVVVHKPERYAVIGPGGIEAARWLRAHSGADDLVATNGHCLYSGRKRCDARTFWLAGYSERRVLVEGWTYEARTLEAARRADRTQIYFPFWDLRLLATNDAAFLGDPAAIQTMDRTFGVRWLVVDTRAPYRLDTLSRLASVRYRAGDYIVLRLL